MHSVFGLRLSRSIGSRRGLPGWRPLVRSLILAGAISPPLLKGLLPLLRCARGLVREPPRLVEDQATCSGQQGHNDQQTDKQLPKNVAIKHRAIPPFQRCLRAMRKLILPVITSNPANCSQNEHFFVVQGRRMKRCRFTVSEPAITYPSFIPHTHAEKESRIV